MCQFVESSKGRKVPVHKQNFPDEIERAIERFFRDLETNLDSVRSDIVAALEAGELDLAREGTLQTQLRTHFGNYSADFETVFLQGGEDGVRAGRAVAARRYGLDIDFDLVPQSSLNALEDWSQRAAGGVLDRMADDVAPILRGAHEEGMSIPDIRDTLNNDVFENRLQDWEAERIARTETISTSNEGNHTALQDADSVIGEEWLNTSDDRTRDTHIDAGGQIVAVDNTFVVGGHEAQHPGDLSLPPEERINCRCTIVPVFRDELTDGEYSRLISGQRLNT